jgi:hypothetical protein
MAGAGPPGTPLFIQAGPGTGLILLFQWRMIAKLSSRKSIISAK